MKKPHFDPTGAIRGGAYSVVITAVVLAILIALNVAVAALPASATEYDISASKLYSVTSNTKSVVNALTDDVTIPRGGCGGRVRRSQSRDRRQQYI